MAEVARATGRLDVAEDSVQDACVVAVQQWAADRVPRDPQAWLIGVARHKLVDHWRRLAREERSLALVPAEPEPPWEDGVLDAVTARAALERLGPHHRLALTLRYLDGLPVPEVARLLDRTLHATEALLVRARAAFRRAYDTPGTEVD